MQKVAKVYTLLWIFICTAFLSYCSAVAFKTVRRLTKSPLVLSVLSAIFLLLVFFALSAMRVLL